mgnify:CR=1 FL=1
MLAVVGESLHLCCCASHTHRSLSVPLVAPRRSETAVKAASCSSVLWFEVYTSGLQNSTPLRGTNSVASSAISQCHIMTSTRHRHHNTLGKPNAAESIRSVGPENAEPSATTHPPSGQQDTA